jgi:glycine betaine/choline ABC-type transport system substrate-binding protein
LLLLGACAKPPAKLKIGAKAGPGHTIVGEVLARHVENKLGISVDRQFNLGGTTLAHEALLGGQIDLYAEDSASAVSQVLQLDLGSGAAATYNLCRLQYGNTFQLDWLDPLGIESPLVLVARKEFANQIQGQTISKAAEAQIPFRLAASREFTSRRDGYSHMQTVYNVRLRDAPRMANTPMELFKLLDEKQVDLVATDATSGLLAGDKYILLEDDKQIFQPSLTGVVYRRDVAERFAKVNQTLQQLSGKLSLQQIRQLTRQVENDRRGAAEVAAEFLRSLGL